MNNYQCFHFTLGPVQGFVSQARRTRDFWAGSFILSWLSAVAMKAVEQQGGKVIFPTPDARFMAAMTSGENGPKQGSIPNRFMAKVGPEFKPDGIETAVKAAWQALADKVWEKDLQAVSNASAEVVWKRQVPEFWDIEWALVDDKGATDTLDRLKSWRTHLPPDEPGVKCMMMDGWQELSGASRPGDEPRAFWEALRTSGKSGMASDLRPNEMLCAIAFIKRRFARCFQNVELDIGGWKARGWQLPHGVPSVHYLAVAPWLAAVIDTTKEDDKVRDALWNFHDAAYDLTGNYGEWDSNIKCVRDAIGSGAKKKWAALDGTVFFEAMLENKNLWGEKSADAEKLLLKLKALSDAANVDPASPFYAVLMMDGDSLGEQMSDEDKQQPIADALASFTAKAGDIVSAHSGFLIYAGGDDVLALLPLEQALSCATALREKYIDCFAGTPVTTSISAAIEYAHAKMPLGKVLHNAHALLDDVAKDGRGRDAIACRVWKPGGMTVEWAQPWEIALKEGRLVIEQLADGFSHEQEEGREQVPFSGKFFYRIGERFDFLNPTKDKKGHWVTSTLNEEQAISLMAMEYMNSGVSTIKTIDKARNIVRPLLEQCRPVVRDSLKPKEAWKRSPCLDSDGALLVRFIAQKGVER